MNEINGHLAKEELDTFIFCFLLIAYLEKNIQKTLYEALLDSQKEELKYPELIDLLLKEKTFTEKIKIFKFIIERGKSWDDMKDFIKFCDTINFGIRNNLFHFKLNELKYKDLDVSKVETQNEIINDLVAIEGKVKKHIEDNIINQNSDTMP